MNKVTNFHNAAQEQDSDLQFEAQMKRQRRLERMNKRFGSLPWLQRHAGTRQISGVASYVFNIASVIGLWYAVNVLIGPFLPVPYLSEVITTVLLVLFEITKRRFSDLFWDHWHQTYKPHIMYGAINFVVLFGISLVGSGFGVYFGVTDTSTDAKQIGVNDDPEAIALQDEITDIDRKIEQHSANRNSEGVIFWPSQKAIEKLEAQRLENKEILKSKYGVYEVKNQTILQEWKIRKDFRAYFIIGLTILFELLFECCMSFNSKYDYRLYLRDRHEDGGGAVAPSPTPPAATVRPIHSADYWRQRLEEEAKKADPAGADHSASPVGDGPTAPPRGASDDDSSSYRVATEELQPTQIDMQIWDMAIRRMKADRDAWASKLRAGKGNPDTNKRHIDKLEYMIDAAQKRINQAAASA